MKQSTPTGVATSLNLTIKISNFEARLKSAEKLVFHPVFFVIVIFTLFKTR